jgi:HTH-type transcriptional regulator / antitoxin HipB
MDSRGAAKLLGEAVRARRRALGLTQKELSQLAGCGLAFLYELEHGKDTVRLDKLLAVLEVLGLALELREGRGGIRVGEGLKRA